MGSNMTLPEYLENAPHMAQTFAHAIIDPQRYYCDPSYNSQAGTVKTDYTARHISRIAPLFRALSIPTFVIFMDNKDLADIPLEERIHRVKGGLHYLKLEDSDVLIPKNRPSAFFETIFETELKARNISNLLISGFYGTECVKDTAFDAFPRGFDTWIMLDAIANEKSRMMRRRRLGPCISRMKKTGSLLTTSAQALHCLKTHTPTSLT